MTRFVPLSVCALVLAVAAGGRALAGGHDHSRAFSGAPVVVNRVPVATSIAPPMPTMARRPYLGTFRPDPTMISYTGPGVTGSYLPAGLPNDSAAMAYYGPFSRLRSIPEEVVTYSRGYDGVLRPTSSGIAYEYTDLRQYRDTGLIPTRYEYDLSTGAVRRPGFGRYLLGQE